MRTRVTGVKRGVGRSVTGGPNGFSAGTQIVIRAISTSGDISGENVTLVDQVFTVGVDDPISLLDGTGSLPVGGSGEIELVVEFTLPQGTVLEAFDLSAVGEATDENGASVSDASDNGSAVDANGNGPADDSDQHRSRSHLSRSSVSSPRRMKPTAVARFNSWMRVIQRRIWKPGS